MKKKSRQNSAVHSPKRNGPGSVRKKRVSSRQGSRNGSRLGIKAIDNSANGLGITSLLEQRKESDRRRIDAATKSIRPQHLGQIKVYQKQEHVNLFD